MTALSGVVFPVTGDTARSTSALGRAVVADALRAVDPAACRAAEQETDWRAGYLVHFRQLVETGLRCGSDARRIAAAGLASLHDRMRVVSPRHGEVGLREIFDCDPDAGDELRTATVTGGGPVDRELAVPYRGDLLSGDALARQLDRWVAAGVVEPDCADAVRAVMANPDWRDLSDVRVVVLGAGAEMGPTQALLRWGGEVIGVDLPRPQLWQGLLRTAGRHAGRLHLPVPAQRADHHDLAAVAGVDLMQQLPAVAAWLRGVDGRLVVGNYVYADGATNMRVCTAADALTGQLRRLRADTALASLATPTDVFAVPADAVAQSERAYRQPSTLRAVRGPLRMLSAGRLLRPNYAPGSDPGICDSLVAQQGPNYALAKRLQRWRAAVERHEGATVCLTVAPPTRTRSVLKNRLLAAAYAGAPAFGVEVFEPATSNMLMAALLVHDLRNPAPRREHVWQEEAHGAVHGGLWRMPYAPRSALGLAALRGLVGHAFTGRGS